LVRIGAPAVGPLVEFLTHKEQVVRDLANAALPRIDPNWAKFEAARAAAPALVAALKNKDGDVRYKAACALRQIGDPGAFGSLIEALTDEHRGVPNAANAALTEIDPNWTKLEAAHGAVPALAAALKNNDWDLRREAS